VNAKKIILRPFLVGILTLKNELLQSAPERSIFMHKIEKKNLRRGTPPLAGGGHPLPHPPPRRLDHRAFGARPLPPPLYKILNTPLRLTAIYVSYSFRFQM